jgi:hypothetical protein
VKADAFGIAMSDSEEEEDEEEAAAGMLAQLSLRGSAGRIAASSRESASTQWRSQHSRSPGRREERCVGSARAPAGGAGQSGGRGWGVVSTAHRSASPARAASPQSRSEEAEEWANTSYRSGAGVPAAEAEFASVDSTDDPDGVWSNDELKISTIEM